MPPALDIVPHEAKSQASASPESASGAALGIYGKSASAASLPAAVLVQRFALQNVARRLLPLEGVAGCLRRRQGGRDTVDIWHLPEHSRAKFGGLQTCSSVWACPVCSAKITERRRIEVRAGIDAWKAQGGDVVLVTYTVRHSAENALSGLVAGLLGALRRVSSGRGGAALREGFGLAGSIRSVEVTWGAVNGWHPHVHQLLFVKPGADYGLLTLHLRKAWSHALALEKMAGVTSRGVDLRHADEDVADYVAKMGRERTWDVEHELVKGPSKLGRSGERFSPIQLLAAFGDTGDWEMASLFQTYASAMKGRRQLVWSPGLRKLLGLGAAKTDEQIAEEKDALGVLLASLSKKEWALVLHFDARAELLNVAAPGDKAEVEWFLQELDWRFSDAASERRFKTSCRDNRTRWDDQKEAEAEELGLTRSEYLAWRHGGIDALAVPAPVSVASQPHGVLVEVRQGRRRRVSRRSLAQMLSTPG